jgi:hypothetical protein
MLDGAGRYCATVSGTNRPLSNRFFASLKPLPVPLQRVHASAQEVRRRPIVVVDKDDEGVVRHFSRERQRAKGIIADDPAAFDADESLLSDFRNWR